MNGVTDRLTLGERIAWYRRRRGLPQEVLAGLVGRTTDWLSKVENGHIPLDRISVVRMLSQALGVTMGELLAESSLANLREPANPALAIRDALVDYRALAFAELHPCPGPAAIDDLRCQVQQLWTAYQDSRFGFVMNRLPDALVQIQGTAFSVDDPEAAEIRKLLAMTYQVAATSLTKVGESDLAWIAADRGLAAARATGDVVLLAALLRTVTHALLAVGRYDGAVATAYAAAQELPDKLEGMSPAYQSVYGMVFLAGSMAAARSGDRSMVRDFLTEADHVAACLGHDGNELWTAFGPTNVAIHRVSTAMELGDVQVALDLGPSLDTSGLPRERRIRHALELARALSAVNRTEEAIGILLNAELSAPEQVRSHFLSRQLVVHWVRTQRGTPPLPLVSLAKRLRVA